MMKSSPMSGVGGPFRLPSNIVYFHDWRHVEHGHMSWRDADGERLPLMPAPTPLPDVHPNPDDLPVGINIRAVPADVDPEPVLTADALNECFFLGGSVVQHGGRYQFFYESAVAEDFASLDANRLSFDKVLRLAESDDGYHWQWRQAAGGNDNVVMPAPASGIHGSCVIYDERGTADERYKAVFMGRVSSELLAEYRAQWPDDVDPQALLWGEHNGAGGALGLMGAVSSNGLDWRALELPMLIQHSDTFQAMTFDPVMNCYVVYPRTWYYGRRAVGRAVSSDFRHFSGLEQVIWPDAGMAPDETWYTPGYTRLPDAPEYQLMFATLWSQWRDDFTPVLHSSPDGRLWNRVPGEPMPHGPPGSWSQCGGAVTTLVPLPGDRVGSLIMGWHVPHKYPREMPGFGQAGWVSWRRGRVTALRAEQTGSFRLKPLLASGNRVVLNYRTQITGKIEVEVWGEGCYRSFDDCDLIAGDELDRVVTWNGEDDIGKRQDNEPIQLRIRMHNAELYSIRFE